MENAAAGSQELVDWLLNNITGCRKIIRTESNDLVRYKGTAIPSFEFANKLLRGDIIEATAFDSQIAGTDITTLSDKYLYVCHYSPESINCLKDSSHKIEVLPIKVTAPDKVRLQRLLKINDNVLDICKNFLENEKLDWSIDYENYLLFSKTNNYKRIIKQIKTFNDKYKIITNLDNFI